jgi:hypothetical protein
MNTKKIAVETIIFAIVAFISVLPFAYAGTWETVTTITGSADQTSKDFSISAQEWRIQWSYTPDARYPSLAFFGVVVYPQSNSTAYIDSFYVNGSTQTSGIEPIHEGMNNFNLEILEANIPSYTIVVQQFADTNFSTANGSSGSINTIYPIIVGLQS